MIFFGRRSFSNLIDRAVILPSPTRWPLLIFIEFVDIVQERARQKKTSIGRCGVVGAVGHRPRAAVHDERGGVVPCAGGSAKKRWSVPHLRVPAPRNKRCRAARLGESLLARWTRRPDCRARTHKLRTPHCCLPCFVQPIATTINIYHTHTHTHAHTLSTIVQNEQCLFKFDGLKQTLLAVRPGIEFCLKKVQQLLVNERAHGRKRYVVKQGDCCRRCRLRSSHSQDAWYNRAKGRRLLAEG